MKHRAAIISMLLLVPSLLCWSCGSGSGDPARDAGLPEDTLPSNQDLVQDLDVTGDPEVADSREILEQVNLLEMVDPMIGTGTLSFRLGSSFVGAAAPFGLAKVGPDTFHRTQGAPGLTHCSGYWYDDTNISGFSHMHLHGTGVPDYGTLLVTAAAGAMTDELTTEEGYSIPLNHQREHNSPGYYSINWGTPMVTAEMTATTRCGLHRYSFSDPGPGTLIFDLSHAITDCTVKDAAVSIGAQGLVEGHVDYSGPLSGRFGGYTLYFSARPSLTPSSSGTWTDGIRDEGGNQAQGAGIGAWLTFDQAGQAPIELAVGLSLVSLEGARSNLEAEVHGRSFDEVLTETRSSWNNLLGLARADFPDDSPAEVAIQYYTSLYHAMLMPTVDSDVEGAYLDFAGQARTADSFEHYTDFSMWDTYRNLHQLLFLLLPSQSRDMLESLLVMGREVGCLPRWVLANGDSGCMVGLPASIIVADGLLHGVDVQNKDEAYEQLKVSAGVGEEPLPSCSNGQGLNEYRDLGYLPMETGGGSVSKTQEFAVADYCVARVAESRGDGEVQTLFDARARYPYNLFDQSVGFFRGKDRNGDWFEDFAPLKWSEEFIEGNAWQYLWFVPHDPAGLAQVMGGRDVLLSRLDEFFDNTLAWPSPMVPNLYYYHGNEPSILVPYLYSMLGDVDSTAATVRWVMDNEYALGPEGLAGNDDAGTMAAWYVFSTLGFYPLPCSGRYIIGSPRVSEAWLQVPGGELHILVKDASDTRPYVQRVTFNEVEVVNPWLNLADLLMGGELVFETSDQPSGFGADHGFQPL